MNDTININKKKVDDPVYILTDIFSQDRLKLGVFSVLIYMLISSSGFIDNVLINFNGATGAMGVTSMGTIIQSVFGGLLIMIFDLLIKKRVL